MCSIIPARGGAAIRERPTIPSGRKRPGRHAEVRQGGEPGRIRKEVFDDEADCLRACPCSPPLLAFGLATVTQAAETKGPVTDDIGVVEIPKDAPIVIGGYWVISGPDTALGLDSKRASKSPSTRSATSRRPPDPVHRRGRQLQCRRWPGGGDQARLVPNIVAVLGPACSSAATAGAPILWKPASSISARRRQHPRSPPPIASPTISAICGPSTAMPIGQKRRRVVLQGAEVPDAGDDP